MRVLETKIKVSSTEISLIISSTNKTATSKLHPNYEQTTSNLQESTSKLWVKYIHTTSIVHPNYKGRVQKNVYKVNFLQKGGKFSEKNDTERYICWCFISMWNIFLHQCSPLQKGSSARQKLHLHDQSWVQWGRNIWRKSLDRVSAFAKVPLTFQWGLTLSRSLKSNLQVQVFYWNLFIFIIFFIGGFVSI